MRRPLTDDVTDPRTPVVVAARRTPVATAGRRLAALDETQLAVQVLAAVAADVSALGVGQAGDEVLLGACTGPGGDPAWVALLRAVLGVEVPGTTVDRQCGSGLEAVSLAAARVVTGAELVLAGGAESASTSGTGRARFAPEELGDPDMGVAAEDLAAVRGVRRERQDAYAARSHALAVAAQDAGVYDAELVPVGDVVRDDRPRRRLTPAVLQGFRGAFGGAGTVTAGNSCGVSDGAAVVAVVDEATRARLGLPGLAVRSVASSGVHLRLPGLGAVAAVRAELEAAGATLADLDAIEITEAFAAQVLACTDELGLADDDPRLCPQGGAIALGHPWGASGALLVVRLFAELVRAPGGRLGLATCAVGGGQGVAAVFERVGP
ncbi:thiolase family protein [Angustibacter aerolatus]